MHECPKSVLQAGLQLVKLRRMCKQVELQAMLAQTALGPATKEVCEKFGARYMESGETETLLHEIAAVAGKAKMAHNSVRKVLADCDVAEPTNNQLRDEAKQTGENAEVASWR